MNPWEAKIIERPDMMRRVIYLTQRIGSQRVYVKADGTTEAYDLNQLPKDDPYMASLEDEQLEALAEALSGAGIKTRPIHQLEGTLEAQSAHLEDMRTLVFKGTKR
jgi:hypothetical protein